VVQAQGQLSAENAQVKITQMSFRFFFYNSTLLSYLITVHFYGRPKEVAFHLPSVDTIAGDLVKKIQHERLSDGILRDLRLEIGRWSLENAGSMVFDKRLGCLGIHLIKRIFFRITYRII
jgi:hypothetical protein